MKPDDYSMPECRMAMFMIGGNRSLCFQRRKAEIHRKPGDNAPPACHWGLPELPMAQRDPRYQTTIRDNVLRIPSPFPGLQLWGRPRDNGSHVTFSCPLYGWLYHTADNCGACSGDAVRSISACFPMLGGVNLAAKGTKCGYSTARRVRRSSVKLRR